MRFAITIHRPHLMKSKYHVIAAAGVVKSVGGLDIAAAIARIRGAERRDRDVIGIQQFPIQIRFEGSRAAGDAGGVEQTRELLADFALLAKQSIQFIAWSHRWARVIVGWLRCSSAAGKSAGTSGENTNPEIAASARKCAVASLPLRRFLATDLQFICHFRR